MTWYQDYKEECGGDGAEGRLVMMFTFWESASTWEIHPLDEELVVCTIGSLVLHQEIGGAVRSTTIHGGEAMINPPDIWHTIDVDVTAPFITPGVGTEIRPR